MTLTSTQPPLVGREQELVLLKESLQKAERGQGSVVLVGGEAGIGKTRLCSQVSDFASKRGNLVLTGHSLPGAPVPYLPFQDAFASILRETDVGGTRSKRLLHSLKRAAPEIAGATPFVGGSLKLLISLYKEYRNVQPVESKAAQTIHSDQDFQTLQESLELLRKLSAKQPILFVIEDLQWADSASIHLLMFLARNISGLPITILATYRNEEIMSEAGGKPQSLFETLRTMRREGICREIQLEGLDSHQLHTAFERILGGQVDSTLADRISLDSAGNPLFAIETVRLLLQNGSIHRINEVWKAKNEVKIEIPATVREVILARIDRLTERERRILDCASVIGEHFEPSLLAEILHLETLGLLEVLDSIASQSRLVRPAEGDYSFTHEKIRQVIYEEISQMRRKELHRLVGEVLEKIGRPEEVSGRLSFHFYEAGVTKKCVDYSLSTGELCLKRGAGSEALTYFNRSIGISANDPSFRDKRLRALEGYGDGGRLLGMWDSARAAYKDYLKGSENPKDKARVTWKLVDCYSYQNFNPQESLELLRRAKEYAGIDPLEKGRIIRTRADVLAQLAPRKNLEEADKLYCEAEKLFETHGANGDHAESLFQHVFVLFNQERFEEAYDMVSKAVQLFLSLRNPYWEQLALFVLARQRVYAGQYDLALEDCSKALEIASRVGNYEGGSHFLYERARIFYVTDDFESAMRESLAGLEFASRQEDLITVYILKQHLALIEIRLSMKEEAQKHLTEISAFLESVEKTSGRDVMHRLTTYTWGTLAQAEAATSDGNWNQCKAKYLACLETFNEFNPSWKQVAITRFAEALMKQSHYNEAREYFLKAAEVYSKMGNKREFERLSRLAEGLTGVK